MGIPGLDYLVELENPVYGVPAIHVIKHVIFLREGLEAIFKKLPLMSELYTVEWVFKSLLERYMQLWLIVDNDEVKGFAITSVKTFPQAKALEIFAVYGNFGQELRHDFYKKLWQYARYHECTKVLGYGRKGWEKGFGVKFEVSNRYIAEVPYENVQIH